VNEATGWLIFSAVFAHGIACCNRVSEKSAIKCHLRRYNSSLTQIIPLGNNGPPRLKTKRPEAFASGLVKTKP
jgi:hypothetical protein